MQIHDELTLGWTVVLRRQPVHLREGRPEGGYTDDYELVGCDCGDVAVDVDVRDEPAFGRAQAVRDSGHSRQSHSG